MLRTTLKISGDFLTEWILSTVRKGECSSEIAMMISAFYIYFLVATTHDPQPTTHDPRPPPKTHDPRPTTFSYTPISYNKVFLFYEFY